MALKKFQLRLRALACNNNMYFRKIKIMKQIKNIPPKELAPGITGYYAHGSSMSFGYVELKEGSIVREHHHPNEQITYIIEGQLDMIIGGKDHTLTAGMYHVIPSHTLHSALAKTDCRVIDAFSPPREDYK
jgi:quercetin dioxygenase-like cupin family protein